MTIATRSGLHNIHFRALVGLPLRQVMARGDEGGPEASLPQVASVCCFPLSVNVNSIDAG